jgi:prepilin-type N-terminal cleavage/methylation domain-containing protein
MNHVAKKQQGFTLIELVLAMTFISVLLLAIALTIIQIGTIYNKGMVLKEINQSSRDIADDVQRTAADAQTFNLSTDLKTNSAGGRLCFGNYTYIWNTAYSLEAAHRDPNVTKAGSKDIRLVKVPDSAKIYCSLDSGGKLAYGQVRSEDVDKAQDLLVSGDHTLGINKFTISTNSFVTDPTTGESLYSLDYTIGSGVTSAMNSDQSACLGPTDIKSDLTYCSVQPFTLVLRTGNG